MAEKYRCAFSGCERREPLTANELYRHGVEDHGEWCGAGYPEKQFRNREGELDEVGPYGTRPHSGKRRRRRSVVGLIGEQTIDGAIF